MRTADPPPIQTHQRLRAPPSAPRHKLGEGDLIDLKLTRSDPYTKARIGNTGMFTPTDRYVQIADLKVD